MRYKTGTDERGKDYEILDGLEDVRLLQSPKPGKCRECDMPLVSGENSIEFEQRREYVHDGNGLTEDFRLCLPCSIRPLKAALPTLLMQSAKVKDQLKLIRDLQEMAKRATRKRGHIYIGRKLGG